MPTPASPNQKLTWDAINDFTPGIYSQSQYSQGNPPLPSTKGYAQEVGTYRCIALPNGGLAPLPVANNITLTTPVGARTTPGYFIVGFHAMGPIIGTGTASGLLDELHFAVEYGDATPDRQFYWFRARTFETGGVCDTLEHKSSATSGVPSFFHGVTFAESRMTTSAPWTAIGVPVVGASWRNVDNGNQFVWAFPDPSNDTTDTPLVLSTTDSGYLVAHEGRLVLATFVPSQPHGVNANMSFNEAINYTDPSNANVWLDAMTIYAPESPAGYGVLASVNTSELLLIKNRGGAVLASGDLDSVNITRLPFVQSTGNLFSLPAVTPSGLYYLANNQGLWNWNGGNGSAKVSPALDDDFYFTNAPFLNPTACAECWGNWVMVSNNWVLDTATGGFWRLENPATRLYQWFSRSFDSTICYATQMSYPTATGVAAYYFKRQSLVTNFSWQSHPLSWSINRRVRVRQVVVRALSTTGGTVTIVFSGTNPDGGDTASYALTIPASTTPVKVQAVCNYSAEDIAVSITSDGGIHPAPIVFEVNMGYEETDSYLNPT